MGTHRSTRMLGCPAVEPRDFRPTPEQRLAWQEFFEGRRFVAGQRSGRTHATELFIAATAATDEDRELALEDLRTKGIACLTDEGKRVDPHAGRRRYARFAAVRFDEERKR